MIFLLFLSLFLLSCTTSSEIPCITFEQGVIMQSPDICNCPVPSKDSVAKSGNDILVWYYKNNFFRGFSRLNPSGSGYQYIFDTWEINIIEML